MIMYETSRLLISQSYQHWISQELFSTGWFLIIGLLIVVYGVWFKLVDKSNLRNLLLLGSLYAVGFGLSTIILEGYYGFWEFAVRITPLKPTIFTLSYTVAPILYMTVVQYNTSWKSFLLWASIGTAVISFGIVPIYVMLGILKLLRGFNYFYAFIYLLTGGIIGRAIYLWIASIEQNQLTSNRATQSFPGLQPSAAKPLPKDDDKKD